MYGAIGITRTRTRLAVGVTVAVGAGVLVALVPVAPTHAGPRPTPGRSINIYEEEDLSGAPYLEPVSVLTITRSAGVVCYANDKLSDTKQFYADCAEAAAAGAQIKPYVR